VFLADTSPGIYFGVAIIDVVLLVITVMIASRKGHSPILYAIFSLFCPLVALVVALIIRPRPGYR
jgi:hypothetical protein